MKTSLATSAALLLLSISALAQTPAPSPADPGIVELARAWSALAEGRVDDAVQTASRMAGSGPFAHDAAGLQIRAEASRDRIAPALMAYEQWLKQAGREDRFLLHPVAHRVLLTLSHANDVALRAAAVTRLMRSGFEVPVTAEQGDGWIAARAEGGDKAAQQQIAQMVDADGASVRLGTVKALAAAGAVPQLTKLLANRAPEIRGAAAEALGDIRGPQAVQALDRVREDPDLYVRLKVAVALAQNGDRQALDTVTKALGSDVADIRVMAAEAFRDNPTDESRAALRASLSDRNPLTRARAAALLGDSDDGTRTLSELLDSENPTVREESARAVEDGAAEDVALIRRMLRSNSPWVQLYGAGALLKAPNR